MDEGRPRPWDRRVSPKTLLRKGVLRNGTETLSEERGGGEEKRTYVRYAFIRSHAACQSSSTSLGAWGNAAQKQSLLLERTGLVLLCHLEKA